VDYTDCEEDNDNIQGIMMETMMMIKGMERMTRIFCSEKKKSI
jgi:hypothetical protein